MAFESGTATDHVDLYNKLYDFLTSNSDLVAADQEWTRAWEHPDASYPYDPNTEDDRLSDIVMQGPGLTQTDQIFVAMRLHEDAANDEYGIYVRGCDAVLSSAEDYSDHPNTSAAVYCPLFAQDMPYWFVANGRRFVVVVKVSSVYETIYGGLFSPFSPPSGYPYPACVGAASAITVRFSNDLYPHTHFVDPGPRDATSEEGSSSSTDGGSLIVRLPGGRWRQFRNNDTSTDDRYGVWPWYGAGLYPNEYGNISNSLNNPLARCRPLLGGDYLLTPAILLADTAEARGALGALDGVFHVAGFGQSAENLVTYDGVDHLVVQNAFRTDFEGFWALKLE